MEITRAGLNDAEMVSRILRDAFSEFEPLYTVGGYRATVLNGEEVAARMAEGPTWLALVNGQAIGTVSAVDRGELVYIRSMAVLPTARGQGVAVALMREAALFAERIGARCLSLSTTPFLHRAIRLYETLGFHREPGTLDLYGTPLIAMRRELDRPSPGAGAQT